jgi:hypothetical protein
MITRPVPDGDEPTRAPRFETNDGISFRVMAVVVPGRHTYGKNLKISIQQEIFRSRYEDRGLAPPFPFPCAFNRHRRSEMSLRVLSNA